jgi:hypothetical protein
MSGTPFSFGDRVRVLTGKYAGTVGTVVDPACAGAMLPPPRPGYYWIRIILQNFDVPAHVHQDDVEHIAERQLPSSQEQAAGQADWRR